MTSVVNTAASAAKAAAPQVAKKVSEQVGKNAHWICNMPTRAIASVLLKQENRIMDHAALYTETEKSGLIRSRRHFKHCLRMLTDQKRVAVICHGPVKTGSSKLAFSVKLTRRGETIYTWYSKMPVQGGEGREDGDQPGLKDAL